MERKTYHQNEKIFEKDDVVDRLIVIQSGIVELTVSYDNRLKNEKFVIERLISGAILNHQSFILKGKTSAQYVCRTPVSCFELTKERMKKVMNKQADLREARKYVKESVFGKRDGPTPKLGNRLCLDYIFHNNADSPDLYRTNLMNNEYKVKFKNAVMQAWIQVKKERAPKDLQTLIQEMHQKKKNAKMHGMNNEVGLAREDEDEQVELAAKTSIFTKEQFEQLKKRIDDALFRMKEQQVLIEKMDDKVHDAVVKSNQRRSGSAMDMQARGQPM